MATQPRRGYDDEFINNAVELVRTSGKAVRTVALELGIPWKTLRNWCAKHPSNQAASPSSHPPLSSSDQQLALENQQLRRRLAQAELQRDILKKALAICSQEPELKNSSR
jgi:transposase-like protein